MDIGQRALEAGKAAIAAGRSEEEGIGEFIATKAQGFFETGNTELNRFGRRDVQPV
jgi:hypothetical protein